eukprot:5002934-Pyramimonas_sp.AAC.1
MGQDGGRDMMSDVAGASLACPLPLSPLPLSSRSVTNDTTIKCKDQRAGQSAAPSSSQAILLH